MQMQLDLCLFSIIIIFIISPSSSLIRCPMVSCYGQAFNSSLPKQPVGGVVTINSNKYFEWSEWSACDPKNECNQQRSRECKPDSDCNFYVKELIELRECPANLKKACENERDKQWRDFHLDCGKNEVMAYHMENTVNMCMVTFISPNHAITSLACFAGIGKDFPNKIADISKSQSKSNKNDWIPVEQVFSSGPKNFADIGTGINILDLKGTKYPVNKFLLHRTGPFYDIVMLQTERPVEFYNCLPTEPEAATSKCWVAGFAKTDPYQDLPNSGDLPIGYFGYPAPVDVEREPDFGTKFKACLEDDKLPNPNCHKRMVSLMDASECEPYFGSVDAKHYLCAGLKSKKQKMEFYNCMKNDDGAALFCESTIGGRQPKSTVLSGMSLTSLNCFHQSNIYLGIHPIVEWLKTAVISGRPGTPKK